MSDLQRAHQIELVERAQAQMPPGIKNRESTFYNPVNHEVLLKKVIFDIMLCWKNTIILLKQLYCNANGQAWTSFGENIFLDCSELNM